MDICIPHNDWGRKSQNVILWENSHYLFFINTVILIETQLPAEKAAHFWNTLSLVLKSKQQTFEWKSHCFHFFFSIWTNILVCYALRKAMSAVAQMFPRILLGICYKSLVILKDESRALSSKVISIFLSSPCDQSLSVVFWHWFKGSLVIQSSTPRASSGESCTLWQEYRHAKIGIPQQILYQLLQDSTVWTKHLTPGSELWALLTPLCVLSRNPAQALSFSLSETAGENESSKMKICQINQIFYGGKEGWRALCSPFRADAAQALLLLPVLLSHWDQTQTIACSGCKATPEQDPKHLNSRCLINSGYTSIGTSPLKPW